MTINPKIATIAIHASPPLTHNSALLKLINCNNVNFGHIVPTEPLLKSALRIPSFNEAKTLNQIFGTKYSGHISFHKRAIKIAEDILDKNLPLQEFVDKIGLFQTKESKIKEIEAFITKYGDNIDVIL